MVILSAQWDHRTHHKNSLTCCMSKKHAPRNRQTGPRRAPGARKPEPRQIPKLIHVGRRHQHHPRTRLPLQQTLARPKLVRGRLAHAVGVVQAAQHTLAQDRLRHLLGGTQRFLYTPCPQTTVSHHTSTAERSRWELHHTPGPKRSRWELHHADI